MAEDQRLLGHEAVHTAALVSDLFDRHLLSHAFIQETPMLLHRAEIISGLLGELYQVVGGYAVGDDVDASRPRQEHSVAHRAKTAARILSLIQKRANLTELEIARELFGRSAVQQDVNADCRLLVGKGVIRRLGKGGRSDPYRYVSVRLHE